MDSNKRTAVVLFNMGGPDTLNAVKPFLFNLFYDPAIIRLSNPWRYLIARFIAGRRENEAKAIYRKIGGKSPIVENTAHQAAALQSALGSSYRVFVAMRYWHPRTIDILPTIQQWDPASIVLLPLYPQCSTTTTESSYVEWTHICQQQNFKVPTHRIGCYPFQDDFLNAYKDLILKTLAACPDLPYRLLFSAHGLPQRIIDAGDPYAWQVERGVESLVERLNIPNLDWRVCYQSRVGPVKWKKPYTDQEIKAAARDKKGVVIVPIAFVSEHSETLVELDIQYRDLANQEQVPFYQRVPTVGCHPLFIECLKKLVMTHSQALGECPSQNALCVCKNGLLNV